MAFSRGIKENIEVRILIIQTAFIGDVILATPIIEALKNAYPLSNIDFIVRKGNEGLLIGHPKLNQVLIWEKKNKYRSLFQIVRKANQNGKYDVLINAQRFLTTGLMASLIKAKIKISFSKNPLSFLMTHKVNHEIGNRRHEIERNLDLLKPLNITLPTKSFKLYPSKEDETSILKYTDKEFITISPASVWYTKQVPVSKWLEFIALLPSELTIILLGGPGDKDICDDIISKSPLKNISTLAGKTSLLQTAALMRHAILNYTNDSAPMHLASSQNANVCAVFCSTVPEFGFGPLSDFNKVVQVEELECKPCGLHGYESCPQGHFKCALDLDSKKLLNAYNDALNFNSELKN